MLLCIPRVFCYVALPKVVTLAPSVGASILALKLTCSFSLERCRTPAPLRNRAVALEQWSTAAIQTGALQQWTTAAVQRFAIATLCTAIHAAAVQHSSIAVHTPTLQHLITAVHSATL